MDKIFLYSSLVAGALVVPVQLSAQKPNVVFILADDLGYGDLSCYGQKKFTTPNIDRLAEEGIRFTRCYSGTTVSAPSRACLLTGLHSGHAPVRGNIEVEPEGQFPLPQMETVYSLFKKAGYVTGAFGKWGLGSPGSCGAPENQGVDRFFGYNCQLLAHNYYPDHLWDNGERVELESNRDGGYGVYAQDLIHEKGLEFIEDNSDRPFFLFLPYVLPHAELIVPKDSIYTRFSGMYPETPYQGCDSGPAFRKGGYCSQPEPHATFAAMVYRLDVYVGQVVAKLKEMGVYDNTLIIFASDNGPHREGGADPDFFDSNGIWRGYKRDLYEGGIRVPFIAVWKGHILAGAETDAAYSFWDLYPTFSEILGFGEEGPDGMSMLPELTGAADGRSERTFYFEFHEGGGRQAVIDGDWKLIRLNASSEEETVWELYNLAEDPSESDNLLASGKVSGRIRRIAERLRKMMSSEHVSDPSWPLLEEEQGS